MAQVYVSAKLPTIATDILTQAGLDFDIYDGTGLIDKAELLAQVSDIEALITPLSTSVDSDVIDAAPNLKIIANFGAGFNNIDAKYARSKGIDVTNTPLVSTVSTAELTFGLIVSVMRRIVEGDQLMRTTGFDGWAPLFFLGHELANKTLGIIGMGSIGQAVAKRMHAFDMNIIYNNRHQLDEATEQALGAKFVSRDELLKQADVVTIHAPLSPETTHMLGAEQFAEMKDSAYLINAARGPVIDESALLTALQQGTLAGAGLDVYEAEPEVADGFKALKNVVLTPHIGNATVEARDAMAKIVATNAVKKLQGAAADYVVNK